VLQPLLRYLKYIALSSILYIGELSVSSIELIRSVEPLVMETCRKI